MENLENILKSCMGEYCINKDDNKNFMTKEQFKSLKGRKDRIIKITEKIKKTIEEVTTILRNALEPYLDDDKNYFMSILDNIVRCIKNIQNEVENICNDSNRFTCEACKSFHKLQADNYFCSIYLRKLGKDVSELKDVCVDFNEYYSNIPILNVLIEKLNKIVLVLVFEQAKQYNELEIQIRGLQRLMVTKPYCIHISKETREKLINIIDNYEKSNGIG